MKRIAKQPRWNSLAFSPSPGTPGEGWGEGLRPDNQRSAVYLHILAPFVAHPPAAIISAADGDPSLRDAESTAFKSLSLHAERTLRPKLQMGNLFAAAAAVQCCIGAAMAAELSSGDRVLVNCFGFGSEQGAFLLEAP